MKKLRKLKVHEYLKSKKKPLHFTLIDPEKTSRNEVVKYATLLYDHGTDAILIGGSTGVTERKIDEIIVEIRKRIDIPIILFPGNISGISKEADAILFMSLLNSENPYFIIGAQVLGAPIVYEYGIEVLPTAYIIVGYGGAAGYIGYARPIPWDKPEIAVAYALAAYMLGMEYIYFEAGSGSPKIVPPIIVKKTKELLGDQVFIITGGGVNNEEKAKQLVEAGADAIVTGTIVEQDIEKAIRIIEAIKG